MDDASLSNRFCHLSNHCIQVESETYGMDGGTNEMFFPAFGAWLKAEHPSCDLERDLLPQIHRLVVQSFAAARELMEVSPTAPYVETRTALHLLLLRCRATATLSPPRLRRASRTTLLQIRRDCDCDCD